MGRARLLPSLGECQPALSREAGRLGRSLALPAFRREAGRNRPETLFHPAYDFTPDGWRTRWAGDEIKTPRGQRPPRILVTRLYLCRKAMPRNFYLNLTEMNSASPQAATLVNWNYKNLLAAWGIAFILQSLFLPCLCDIGTAKILFAYTFDALVLLRIGVACFLRETGVGWKFYAWLLCSSPLWIEGIAYLVFGKV